MKKTIVVVAVAFCVSLTSILLGVLLPKEKEYSDDVVLSVNGVTLNVGETKEINYSVSNANAVLTFKISNDNIAKIASKNNTYCVEGLIAGETELTISCTYNGEKIESSAKITVNAVDDKNNDEIDNSDDKNDDTETPVVPTTPSEEEIVGDDKNDLEITFTNTNNCTYSDKVLTLTPNKLALFTLTASENIQQEVTINTNSTNLVITKINNMRNTFSIKAQETGIHTITINIDNSTAVITVIVGESL